jgi:hypothetical protein
LELLDLEENLQEIENDGLSQYGRGIAIEASESAVRLGVQNSTEEGSMDKSLGNYGMIFVRNGKQFRMGGRV